MMPGRYDGIKSFVILTIGSWIASAAVLRGADDAAAKPELRLDAGGHAAAVRSVLFLPGNREFVSVSFDKTIRRWDVAAGECVQALPTPAGSGKIGALHAAALSPDGRTLAVCGLFPQHEIFLVDLESQQIKRTLKGHTNTVQCLAWTPDGKRLASGSHDKTARVWDAANGAPVATFPGHQAAVYSVACSPDSKQVVSASLDKTALIWSINPAKRLYKLEGHTGEVMSVAWSPDAQTLATGSLDKTVRLWNYVGKLLRTFDKLGDCEVNAVTILADSKKLVYTQGKGPGQHCGVLDMATGEVLTKFEQHADSVLHASVSSDSKFVASGDSAGVICLWDAANGELVRTFAGRGKVPNAVGWSADGLTIGWGAAASFDRPEAERPLDRAFDVTKLEFTDIPNSSFLRARLVQGSTGLISSADTTVDVIVGDSKTATLEMPNSNEKQYNRVRAFSLLPGDKAALAAEFGLYLHDAKTGKRIRAYRGHTAPVWAVAPSPDGQYLLSASGDMTLRIWSPLREDPLLTLFFAEDDWVAFTPEGYYAASAGGERLMGWQVEQGPDRMAAFYPAERFHNTLYQPELIKKLLRSGSVERAAEDTKLVVTRVERELPPFVAIATPDKAKLTVSTPEVIVKAVARQVGQNPIRAMQVLLDGRPLGGQAGKVEIEKPEPEVRREFTVPLAPGQTHRISVQAYTKGKQALKDGTLGLSSPIEVFYKPQKPEERAPNLYVLAMGVSDYTDPTLTLKYAAADARAIDEAFRNQSAGLFKEVVTKLVVDKECTRAGILSGLTWLKKQMTQHDVGVIFFSGHGDRDETGGFYLLPADVERENMVVTAVPDSQIKGVLQGIPGRLLILLDACHAGALSEDSRKHAHSLTDDLVRDLSNTDTGVIVMASSMGREYSLESNLHKNGYFTVAVAEGLAGREYADSNKDGVMYITELDSYVSQRVKELTNGQQHPVTGKPTSIRAFPLSKKSL